MLPVNQWSDEMLLTQFRASCRKLKATEGVTLPEDKAAERKTILNWMLEVKGELIARKVIAPDKPKEA